MTYVGWYKLLIDQHGQDAALEAAGHADALRAKGDLVARLTEGFHTANPEDAKALLDERK